MASAIAFPALLSRLGRGVQRAANGIVAPLFDLPIVFGEFPTMFHLPILHLFEQYPEEGRLVGWLVVAFGEIEHGLAFCIGDALGDDDQAGRIMFRLKGEESRIEVADAIIRPVYEKLKIADAYNETLGAVRHCKTIRNQYAHSTWLPGSDGLMFGAFEKGAKTRTGELKGTFTSISKDVLRQQLTYFTFTDYMLTYLPELRRWAAAGRSSPPPEAPARVPRPPLNSLPETDKPE